MSRIDDLIDQYAPDGVTYRALGDVVRIRNGRDHKGLGVGDVPVYGSGGVMRYVDTYAYDKPSVLIPRKGSLGNLFYVDAPFWTVDTIFYTEINEALIVPKFLYYYLGTVGLADMNQAGGVPSQTQTVLNRLRVPVPPLEVQREIVRILDAFTELGAALEAELEARKQQYAHYRDQLLTFPSDGSVRWLPMGDVVKISRGASPRPIQRFLTDSTDGIPWIKIGDVPMGGKYITGTAQYITREGAAKSRRIAPGDFVLSNSMSFGRPYISKIDGCIHDGWLAISDFEESYLPDFLFHLLRSAPIQAEFTRRAGDGGAVSNLNSEIVRSVVVPVPPLDEQQRISAILDKFEVLVSDLSSGLPAEIAARRQQYAYYRDRLLTFEEAVA